MPRKEFRITKGELDEGISICMKNYLGEIARECAIFDPDETDAEDSDSDEESETATYYSSKELELLIPHLVIRNKIYRERDITRIVARKMTINDFENMLNKTSFDEEAKDVWMTLFSRRVNGALKRSPIKEKYYFTFIIIVCEMKEFAYIPIVVNNDGNMAHVHIFTDQMWKSKGLLIEGSQN